MLLARHRLLAEVLWMKFQWNVHYTHIVSKWASARASSTQSGGWLLLLSQRAVLAHLLSQKANGNNNLNGSVLNLIYYRGVITIHLCLSKLVWFGFFLLGSCYSDDDAVSSCKIVQYFIEWCLCVGSCVHLSFIVGVVVVVIVLFILGILLKCRQRVYTMECSLIDV